MSRAVSYVDFFEEQDRERERKHAEWVEKRRVHCAPFVAEWIAAAGERMDLIAPDGPGVYFVEAVGTGLVKIGRSTDIAKRLDALRSMNALPLRLLRWEDGGSARERELHERWEAYREHGEWFIVSTHMAHAIGHATGAFIARVYEAYDAECGAPV